MTDTMNSQNTDLSSWDTLYNIYYIIYILNLTMSLKLIKIHSTDDETTLPKGGQTL